MKKTINMLQEFSVPLIAGVIAALVWANVDAHSYHEVIHYTFAHIGGHDIHLHFLVNDIFMVLFFGIAAVEIMQAVLPGGSLNPPSKALNPLMGTLGGVFGPVGAFFILCWLMPLDMASMIASDGALAGQINAGELTFEAAVKNGWGIPTATDIALAWLVARLIFGAKHPAVSYLLLLAVADDAIGLGIIAVAYPNPDHPVAPIFLLITVGGMIAAFALRKMKVKNMWLYLLFGGLPAWLGLIMAHLHPALALVFIVPFMPADTSQPHGELFEDETHEHSVMADFEHKHKGPVDFGLFAFGLANAGVAFAGINSVTWIILGALLIGKTVGITFFGYGAHLLGSKLPKGMNFGSLVVAGMVAGMGLTVALFVAGEAYQDPGLQGAAKMGALFSAGAAVLAFILAKVFRVEKVKG